MKYLYNTGKNVLNYLKLILSFFSKNYYKGKDPIFVLTANRSGSSLLSNILRQHPDLYSLDFNLKKINYDKINNHNRGFSEDFIWECLNDYRNDHFNLKGEGYLWSHPKYIADFYKEDFFFKKLLKKEIYKKNIKKKIKYCFNNIILYMYVIARYILFILFPLFSHIETNLHYILSAFYLYFVVTNVLNHV